MLTTRPPKPSSRWKVKCVRMMFQSRFLQEESLGSIILNLFIICSFTSDFTVMEPTICTVLITAILKNHVQHVSVQV